MKPDQQRVCDIIVETVKKLCASGLKGSKTRIQGVIAVTVDDNDFFVIQIDDTVCNLSAGSVMPSEVSVSPLSTSLASVSMSSPGSLSGHKRARHRLVFESPDVSRHRFTESRDHAMSLGISRRRLVDSKDHAMSCDGQNYSEASQKSINGGNMIKVKPLNETDNCNSPKNAMHCDENPSVILSDNQASSLVIVDSDDEDVSVLAHWDVPSTDSACQPFMNVVNGYCADRVTAADTLRDADTMTGGDTDTVIGLRIADVVGSVTSWSSDQDTFVPVTAEMSPTVIKDDVNLYQGLDCDEEDDVSVVKEEPPGPTQPSAARPLNYSQVTCTCHVY